MTANLIAAIKQAEPVVQAFDAAMERVASLRSEADQLEETATTTANAALDALGLTASIVPLTGYKTVPTKPEPVKTPTVVSAVIPVSRTCPALKNGVTCGAPVGATSKTGMCTSCAMKAGHAKRREAAPAQPENEAATSLPTKPIPAVPTSENLAIIRSRIINDPASAKVGSYTIRWSWVANVEWWEIAARPGVNIGGDGTPVEQIIETGSLHTNGRDWYVGEKLVGRRQVDTHASNLTGGVVEVSPAEETTAERESAMVKGLIERSNVAGVTL